MIIDDFDILRSLRGPSEADAVLVIDPDAPLPLAVTAQGLQPVARRGAHVVQAPGQIQLHEFAQDLSFDRCPFADMLLAEQTFGILRPERLDHVSVNNGYR